jgi:thioredoxin-like negative regulator of GroEL
MRTVLLAVTGVFVLVSVLTACGGKGMEAQDVAVTVTATPAAPAEAAPANSMPAVLPPEVIDITSSEQFDAEIAKARPEAVVVADFHAEWCLPCRKLGPELVALAQANPGKFLVLRVDFDQHPKLIERFQVEVLPLVVKFKDGKEVARLPGYEKDKAKFAAWLGIR